MQLKEKNYEAVNKLKEGEEIERLRLQNMLEKERLRQIELEEKKLLREDYMQQIDDVRKMREIDRLRTEVSTLSNKPEFAIFTQS